MSGFGTGSRDIYVATKITKTWENFEWVFPRTEATLLDIEKTLIKLGGIKVEGNDVPPNPIEPSDLNPLSPGKKFLNNPFLSDITVKLSDETCYHLHKIILASHSPVFYAMFEDAKSEEMILCDDPKLLKQLFEYIYTKRCEPNIELLHLIEKYELNDLMESFLNFIQTMITTENVVKYLTYAEKYNNEKLKQLCIKFIKYKY